MPLVSFSASTVIRSADINANFSGIANGSLMSSPSIANVTLTTKFLAYGRYDNGNSGSSKTIDWSNGDRQKLTISAACTLAYSNAQTGQIITLEVVENGTGNFAITMPANTKYPGGITQAFTTTPSAINLVQVYYDGTNYLTTVLGGYA